MRRLAKLVILTGLLGTMVMGCADKNQNTAGEAAASASETPVVTEKEETEATADTAGETVYPLNYVDIAGREVLIEKQPVKIAVNYLPLWETLMMLDVMPIAASGAANYAETWDPFEEMDLSSIVDLGDSEVNLELLAELEPDIILEQVFDLNSVDVGNLEKISKVAVFGNEVKMDWRYSLREVGKVVGKAQKAEEVIAEVEQNLSQAKEKLKERYAGKTVALISMMGEDQYYYAYRPDLYDEETGLGLKVPEGFTTSETYEQVSMEALVEMNPDYLFVNVFDGDEAMLEELNKNNEVWKSLTAVKEEHLYRLDGSGHACSALSTVHTIDVIVDTLLSEE